jgi:perosamine synthetase
MIPLAIPNLSGNEADYLAQCIETNFVSSVGPFVDQLEQAVADACGAAGAVATASGTSGLHVALTAVGVERDDLVILPSFTFIASANAIAHAGADPWLIDVEPSSWTLDPELLARSLAAETEMANGRLVHRASGRRVGAIMPVYTLGMPSDMEPIVELAKQYHLPAVADAAAALGATYRQRAIGTLGADLTVFSFNGNKTVTCGGGGAVAGAEGPTLDLVRHLTTTARVGADYDHDRVGFNYRMTNIQAAVGCAQLERLDTLVKEKRKIAGRYDAAFEKLPGVGLFPEPSWAGSACWLAGILLDPEVHREPGRIRKALLDAGIGARAFWKPVHLQAPYAAAPRTPMPVSDRLWQAVLTLPCSTGLSDDEQAYVIDQVKDILTR